MPEPTLRLRRALVLGPAAGVAGHAARLLADRLHRRTGCAVERRDGPAALPEDEDGTGWDAVLVVAADAAPEGDPGPLAALRRRFGGALPAAGSLPPEGFALRTLRPAGAPPLVVVLGADGRGALYGVGRLLREVVPGDGWGDVPRLHLEDAPAYPVRGTALSQTSGAVAAALHLPRWTAAQWEEHVADLALWGYNLLRCGGQPAQVEVAGRYGLRIEVSVAPNRIADAAVTEEMRGTHFQRSLVCPSNAAARAQILAEREALFRACPRLDVLYQPSGDHAGCHCPRCRPWARTYLALAEEIATLLRRSHPDAEVWLSNQQLSVAENRLLLRYLNEVRPTWAQALHYGPSGDEASPYLRPGEVNPDWHTYPGFGTVNRYLAHVRAALPAQYALVLYPDLTHYVQSQFGLETADPAVVRFHGRDAYFVRAEGYRRVFERVGPLISGSSGYTEGIYDDVQKALWAQWLWRPERSATEALETYARWAVGPAAAGDLTAVLRDLERHWDGPLPERPALDATAARAAAAAGAVPPRLRAGNWRLTYATWRARADQLVRHKLDAGRARGQRRAAVLAPFLRPGGARTNLAAALAAARAGETARALALLRDVVAYEDAGPGGWYDDLGHPGRQPHLRFGHAVARYCNVAVPPELAPERRLPWDVPIYDPANRPSQNSFVFTYLGEPGVRLAYSGLDPATPYRVRLTYCVPRTWPRRFAMRQRLEANGALVHAERAVPEFTAERVEYPLPPEATGAGSVELHFRAGGDSMGTAVSEVWLLPATA